MLDRGGFDREGILHVAARAGHREVIDALIASGFDVNESWHDGRTPLMYAAFGGAREAVERLLTAGADLTAIDAQWVEMP